MSAGDERVLRARGALAAVQRHPVDALPPSVLMREDAELRRHLENVLAFVAAAWDDIQYEPPPPPGLQPDLMRQLLAELPREAADGDISVAEFLTSPSESADAGTAVLSWLRETRAAAALTDAQRETPGRSRKWAGASS